LERRDDIRDTRRATEFVLGVHELAVEEEREIVFTDRCQDEGVYRLIEAANNRRARASASSSKIG